MTESPRVFAGRYEVLERVYRDPALQLHRARDLETQAEVQLSLLPLAPPSWRVRLERELEAWRRHDDPRFLVARSAEVAGEALFLVSPWTRGQRLSQRAGAPLQERLADLRACAAALAGAHERGLTHQHLSPLHLLRCPEGLRIDGAGWGWYQAAAQRRATQSLLSASAYLAPEQLHAREAGTAHPTQDVWALGVLLYHALSGQLPFPAGSLVELARSQRRAPAPPRALSAGAPPGLSELCLRALALEPTARPPHAGAFLEALLEHEGQDSQPPAGAPSSAATQVVAGNSGAKDSGPDSDSSSGALSSLSSAELGSLLLERFRIEEVLGRGAFGIVYRARDLQQGREVALKVLLRPTRRRRVRFQREGEVIARFDHPHIVRLLDSLEDAHALYHVLEVVDGTPLEELAPLPPARALRAVRDVALALDYAHQRGVLHRDVKPANIQVRPDGSGCLLDFGVALDQEEISQLTRTGETVGTLSFMAPEQLSNARDADARSDVYGLGASLAFALSGEELYPPEAGPLAMFSMSPVSPRVHQPSLSPQLEALCLRAVEKDPADRFPDAAAFAEALDELLQVEEAAAPPPRSVPLIPLGLAALGLAALGAGALVVARSPERAASPTPTPSLAPPPDAQLEVIVRAELARARELSAQQRSRSAAERALRQARRLAGRDADLLAEVDFELASLRLRRGRYEEAAELFASLELPQARLRRAIALLALAREEEASEEFTRLAEGSRSPLGVAARAQLSADSGAAKRLAQEACRAAPGDPYLRYLRGRLLQRRDPGAALAAFAEARALLPDEPLILAGWGRLELAAARDAGRPAGPAIQALREAVDLCEPRAEPRLRALVACEVARELVKEERPTRDALDTALQRLANTPQEGAQAAEPLFWRGVLKLRLRQRGGGSEGALAHAEEVPAEQDLSLARRLAPQEFTRLLQELPDALREAVTLAGGR